MIVAGFGFRKDATVESLHSALSHALAALRPDPASGPDTATVHADRTKDLTTSEHGAADRGPRDRGSHALQTQLSAEQSAGEKRAAAGLPSGVKPSADHTSDRPTGHPTGPDLLATAQTKVGSPAMQALARRLPRPLHGVAADVLAAQATATYSAAAQAAYGTGSVAEAAALAAAGSGARLLAPRAVSGDRKATCALALGIGPAPDAMGTGDAIRHTTNPESTT
ncbi:cobalamin biosynthesis protein [Roseicitreum antarcticum]|uniref:Cobalamin synthesis G C-terminus n=1 Tax=Roseicitreum antarcticum TaxID=564137 RepID=A0A1H2UBR5_9RHOB|nr:cobalamin biosynthesis protein [Roseicitreum antarcticum]SDW53632.1 Cobalamin synthesis G C-terminus [Roseicitreum antarcticum]